MKRKIFFGVVVFLIIWFLGLIVFSYKISNLAMNNTQKTDAIVVLTGGRHRLAEAFALLNKGMSNRLFISGVQKDISMEDLKKRYGVQLYDAHEVTLDKVGTNTFENARETSLWMKRQKIKSIRLVTSNYHILRSLVEFKRWNNNVEIILHPVFSEKVNTLWWTSIDGFSFLAREYNKFLFALVRAKVYSM